MPSLPKSAHKTQTLAESQDKPGVFMYVGKFNFPHNGESLLLR